MTDQVFTAEEIKDAARMAHVYCPGFSEEKFESLMELEKRISDSGYLGAVQGLLLLEKERGVSCTQALEVCEHLIKQKTELEQRVPVLEKTELNTIARTKQANAEYDQVKKAIAKARRDLEQIGAEHTAAENKLETLKKKAETEKQRIRKEVEECYRQAEVTREEVVTAGKIKADIEKHGFSLDLVLGLSKEFAGYKNARDELAGALKEYGSLSKYSDVLAESAEKERDRVIAEINKLESQKQSLAGESGNLRNILSQLQENVACEEELRRFHNRYVRLSGLLDELSSWTQVFFMRCAHPANTVAGAFDRTKGNHHFWSDQPLAACPVCGYPVLEYERKIYQYLNWPEGYPIKIALGE